MAIWTRGRSKRISDEYVVPAVEWMEKVAELARCREEIDRLQADNARDTEAIEALKHALGVAKKEIARLMPVIRAARVWRMTDTGDANADLIVAVDALKKENADA